MQKTGFFPCSSIDLNTKHSLCGYMPPCVTEFTVTLICEPVQIQQALTLQINITTYTAPSMFSLNSCQNLSNKSIDFCSGVTSCYHMLLQFKNNFLYFLPFLHRKINQCCQSVPAVVSFFYPSSVK